MREMRRKNQMLEKAECERILTEATSGVLALHGDEGYPYAVPLSFVYEDGKIYFHGARSGHKIDAIKRDPKASFCVIDRDEVIPEKFTTHFRSVIVFGTVRIMEDDAEKRAAVKKLAQKYSPEESDESTEAEIEREWKALCMLEFTAEHISGKEAIELVRMRDK